MKPEPGSPHQLDADTRIVAFDCDRLGRLYEVQVRRGPVEWQSHGSVHEDYGAALEQASRVSRRERGERSERPDRYVESDVDDQPDSHAMRIPMYPEASKAIPNPPYLSERIRRGRRRVGWR